MKYNAMKSKTILITGASKGIGKEIAKELLESDSKLILCGSNEKSFENFDLSSENIKFYSFDLKNEEETIAALNKIEQDGNSPDIIINNAGIGIFRNFTDFKIEEINSMMNVNFKAPILITQKFLPKMLENKFGVVANIVSVAAVNNFLRSSIYGASKSALLEAMKTLRLEVRKNGVKVINVLPGATETSIWSPKVRAEFGNLMLSPNDLAKTIVRAINDSIENNLIIEEITIRPQNGDL